MTSFLFHLQYTINEADLHDEYRYFIDIESALKWLKEKQAKNIKINNKKY